MQESQSSIITTVMQFYACMCIKYNTKKGNHLVKCKIKETTHIAVANGNNNICQEESVMHMSYIILKGIYLALEVLEVSH